MFDIYVASQAIDTAVILGENSKQKFTKFYDN